jgi:hypothetical protein
MKKQIRFKMSEITKKEFASAMKWTWVIVVAAIAYSLVAPNYFLMKQNAALLRFNKATGVLEELGEDEWVKISGE